MTLLYDELRGTARHYMQLEREGHTQTTALVCKAYLRLAGVQQVEYRDRVHLVAIVAQMNRHLLGDHAGSRGYLKRGVGVGPISVEDFRIASLDRDAAVAALDVSSQIVLRDWSLSTACVMREMSHA